MNVRFDTSLLSKESTCSCDRCDSAFCFSIRNTDISCACNPCRSENETDFTKFYPNIPIDNVIVSDGQEADFKDESDKYEKLKNEYEKQSKDSSKKSCMENKTFDDDQYFDPLDNFTCKEVKSMIDSISSQLAGQIFNLQCNRNNERMTHKELQTLKYPNNIFKKIRDVYNACSCKVCECIVGNSTMTKDFCDCKPCDCNKCKFTLPKDPSKVTPVNGESCPCERCERKQQREGLSSDHEKGAYTKTCDSNPKHQNWYNYPPPCDCKPCQCVDCQVLTGKLTRRQMTLVVAPMEQNLFACDCAPCDCTECVQSYRISNNATNRRDVSTEVNRHPRCQCEACVAEACIPDGNDSCWCARQKKIMSKPFQKNSDEYDIRRAEFSTQFKQLDVPKAHNTMAMFPKFSKTLLQKRVHSKQYANGLSECIYCSEKENTESVNVPEEDCQSNRKKHYPDEQWLSSNFKKCMCDTCECINCESRKPGREASIVKMHKTYLKSNNNSTSKEYRPSKHDNHQPVENRENHNISVTHRPVYTFQNNVHSSIKHQHTVSNYKGILLNSSVSDCKTAKPHGIHVHKSPLQYIDRKDAQSQEADTQRVSEEHYVTNKKDRRSTDGDMANDPLIDSYASLIKDSGSILRNKKSRGTFFNADYLAHFLKSNVEESYINDFMKSILKPRISRLNVNNDKLLHITTSDINVKSLLSVITNSSFNPKHVNENVSEEISFTDLCREEIIKNIQKKDSGQELIDYYRQTKCSITAQLSENYRKVQDTLKKARENSQNLVKLQQKYEEANKRFHSVSNRLNMSNLLINYEKLCKDHRNETVQHDTYKNKLNTNIDLLPSMVRDRNIAGDVSRYIKTKTNIHPYEKERYEYVPTENIKGLANKNINNEMNFYKRNTELFTDFYNYKLFSNENKQTDQGGGENNFKESFASREITHESKDIKDSYIELKEKQAEKEKNKEYRIPSSKMKVLPKYTDFKHDASIVTEESSTRQDQTVNKEIIDVTECLISKSITLSNGTILDLQAPKQPKSNIIKIKKSENNYTTEIPKTEYTVTEQNNYRRTEPNIRSIHNVIPVLPNLESKSITLSNGTILDLQAPKPPKSNVIINKKSENNDTTEIPKKEFTVTEQNNYRLTEPNIRSIHNVIPILPNLESKSITLSNGTILDLLAPKQPKSNIITIKKSDNNDTTEIPKKESTVTEQNNDRRTEPNIRSIHNVIPILPNLESKSITLSNGTILDLQAPKQPKSNVIINKKSENNDTAKIQKTDSTVTKQNNYHQTEPNINSIHNVIPILPNLEMEVQDAIRLFTSRSKDTLRVNSSLGEEIDGSMPTDKRDDLQVNYVCLRKVSDHTVFVKWNAPENLDRVQGYEILVDGCLVHKINKTTKCMAVVTGLSATKKILLTVRTVPKVPDGQRMLATTIVYRPKHNK